MTVVSIQGAGEVRNLAEAIGRVPIKARLTMRPALQRAGQEIKADAQARASWSSRIPGSLTLRVQLRGARLGIVLAASSARAPHARPFEGLLNPQFRHPVFGNREAWVTQGARPFMWPAAQAGRDRVTDAVVGAVEAALRDL